MYFRVEPWSYPYFSVISNSITYLSCFNTWSYVHMHYKSWIHSFYREIQPNSWAKVIGGLTPCLSEEPTRVLPDGPVIRITERLFPKFRACIDSQLRVQHGPTASRKEPEYKHQRWVNGWEDWMWGKGMYIGGNKKGQCNADLRFQLLYSLNECPVPQTVGSENILENL